jgi:hypothetical protein
MKGEPGRPENIGAKARDVRRYRRSNIVSTCARLALLGCEFVLLCFVCGLPMRAQKRGSTEETNSPGRHKSWLWVIDTYTHIGVAGASVNFGPGNACLSVEKSKRPGIWTVHYKTGPAGRVLIDPLPRQFSCRITLNGRELPVETFSQGAGQPSPGTIVVNLENREQEGVEDDYWTTTDEPTVFRDYLEDQSHNLIAGVRIRSLRSNITAESDANGLFTLKIPASYRKGKPPSLATETLVFSKAGYQTIEYRDLVLNPGVCELNLVLKRGKSTEVHRNLSIHNNGENQIFCFKGPARGVPEGFVGEILSFQIVPSTFRAGWTTCGRNAKAILKGRNLKSVDVFLYPTGTGLGENGPYLIGHMIRVQSSLQEDTWELPIGNLMTTHFWAQAIDENGKTIKSIDLCNVSG